MKWFNFIFATPSAGFSTGEKFSFITKNEISGIVYDQQFYAAWAV